MKFLSKVKKISILSLFLLLGAAMVFAQELHPAEKTKAARSMFDDFKTSIEFQNESSQTLKIYWLDDNGRRSLFATIAPHEKSTANTYLSQPWLVTDEGDNAISLYYPDAQPRIIQIRNSDISNDNYDKDYDDPRENYDTKPLTICSDQPIPHGYLIIGASSDWNCPNWTATGKNAYTLKHPSRTEPTKICGNQAIPRGFVVTAAGSEWGCPNWSATANNAYTIKRPGEIEEICSISEVPPRYVICPSA